MNHNQQQRPRLPPPATLGIISICCIIYAYQIISNVNIQIYTMCPRLVLYTNEYYRIITSTLFHANIMHIGMNMLSTSAISTMLEKHTSSLRMIFIIWYAILFTSIMYLCISYLAYKIFNYTSWMYEHSIGFSGVLFHLSVLESYSFSGSGPRSIFGFVTVPPILYPWVLLVVLQFIMPNLSFLGHLSGILTGTLQHYGIFHIVEVSDSFLIELESKPILRKFVSLDGFVPTTITTTTTTTTTNNNNNLSLDPSSLLRGIRKILSVILKFFRDVFETILVCIFGRGYRLNNNIRIWEQENRSGGSQRTTSVQLPTGTENDSSNNDDNTNYEREPLTSRIV